MTDPLVTVVIPTRDRCNLLAASGLPSAFRQEAVEIEVVVVDDGSTDATAELLRAHGNPRLRTVRHERPRGVAAARNSGIAAARGRWIAFLDDDDLWAPRKLATQLRALDAANGSFAYCAAVVLREDGVATEVIPAPAAERIGADILRRNVMPAGSSNVLAAAELLRRVGGFDEEIAYLEDWDLWIKLSLAGRPAACPEVLVGYVRHEGRMLLGGAVAFSVLERLGERYGADGFAPDRAALLGWIAAEHRKGGRRLDAVGIYLRTALMLRDPRHLTRAAATLLDRRGSGLRRSVSRRAPQSPDVVGPEWLQAL